MKIGGSWMKQDTKHLKGYLQVARRSVLENCVLQLQQAKNPPINNGMYEYTVL
jgi:hypothetical protein